MTTSRVVYVDGSNPSRSDYPLREGYYLSTRGPDGSWAIHDRTRYATSRAAEHTATEREAAQIA